jgi:hypothetical protein
MHTYLATKKALVDTINKYSPYLNYAVTLTMKQRAKIHVRRFDNWDGEYNERWLKLNEEIAKETLKYFNARLTHYAYGKDARKTSTKYFSQPLVIAALEGVNGNKRLHFHLAVGNLPTKYLFEAHAMIKQAWDDCDFAYGQIKIDKLTNTYGWLDYIAKEESDGNANAICLNSINQPQNIQQLVVGRKLI